MATLFIIQASCPAHFQSLSIILLVNTQPKELASINPLGANQLVDLSSSLSTSSNQRSSTRLLQVREVVCSVHTEEVIGLTTDKPLKNFQWLLISHWMRKTVRWSLSKMSLRMRMSTKMGMRAMWLFVRMKRTYNFCGLSKYLGYLSHSTANDHCLESFTAGKDIYIYDYHAPLRTRLTMTCYDLMTCLFLLLWCMQHFNIPCIIAPLCFEFVLADIIPTLFCHAIQLLLLYSYLILV